jgi:uroporphyrinogen decarboxylase
MNKRDLMFSLLDSTTPTPYTPAAFFLHFDPAYHRGRPAVEKHLEFFRYTDMDFVKIQYENRFPPDPTIQRPEDWKNARPLGPEFFEQPLLVVEGLVEAAQKEAPIIVTLYSPFMLAAHMVGFDQLTEHLRQDPEAVRPGLEIVTDSLLHFVRGCLRLGIDGFYASTQGGEADRFPGTTIFQDYVKPLDLVIWDHIADACPLNILHVCDYRLPYSDLATFLDYPGQIVNSSLELKDRRLTPQEVSGLFNRPFMGGLDRLGVLAAGDPPAVSLAAEAALAVLPEKSILAADCTVPNDTSWENLRAAIAAAHAPGEQ